MVIAILVESGAYALSFLFARRCERMGDRWCLCVQRWKQALEVGVAPPIVVEATHISALEFVDLEDLQAHAVEGMGTGP